MDYKSIRVYDTTFDGLEDLCSKYNASKTELIEAMQIYFSKTGISPFEPTDTTTEVKHLKNQLISFIRTQEKEKLNPMIKKVDLIVETVSEHIQSDSKEYLKQLINKLAGFIEDKNGIEANRSDIRHKEVLKVLSEIKNELSVVSSKPNKKGIFG